MITISLSSSSHDAEQRHQRVPEKQGRPPGGAAGAAAARRESGQPLADVVQLAGAAAAAERRGRGRRAGEQQETIARFIRPRSAFPTLGSDKKNKTIDQSTEKAVNEIWLICRDHLLAGDLDQLVLDELGLAIAMGFINKEEVISTLEQRPLTMDIILTGPAIPPEVMGMADQITELRSGH